MILDTISGFVYALQKRSVRLQWADGSNEKTWLNHGLLTLGVGLLVALVGWPFGLALLGAQLGCAGAVLYYVAREVRQWRGKTKPAGWWWDASLDVTMPAFFASAVIAGPWAFLGFAVLVATLHFFLRPTP